MKITKLQLKQVIKEELSAISETDDLESRLRTAPTNPLDYDMSAEQQIELGKAAERMIEIFVRVPSGLQKDLKDLVILNMEQIEKFQRPPQKPFSITDPGETPTLKEQIKKILSEA